MAAAVAGSVPHSVFPMGDLGKHGPNFGDLGKPTVTVDVLRLQAELRALHQRIEFLELAAAVEAEERAREDHDRSSGSSGPGVAGGGSRAAQADDVSLTDSLTVEPQGEPPPRYLAYMHTYYVCQEWQACVCAVALEESIQRRWRSVTRLIPSGVDAGSD